MTRPERAREVDRAALLGAAMAAVVALTFADGGEWDWLSLMSGAALLTIVAAFFRLPDTGARRHVELAAAAAVVGLCSALVLALPVQAVLSVTPVAAPCRAAGALAAAEARATDPAVARSAAGGADPTDLLAAAAGQRQDAAFEVCIGAATNRVLWLPALVVAAAVIGVGELRTRRR